jgi:hypothetical protein
MIRPTALLSLVFVRAAAVAGVSLGHSPSQNVDVAAHERSVDVSIGCRPFTTFVFDSSVAKPYFYPLRTTAALAPDPSWLAASLVGVTFEPWCPGLPIR